MFIAICLGIFGSMLGSFAVATTWRLRAGQLAADTKNGYKLTKTEKQEYNFIKRLASSRKARERSHCLHCQRQLTVIDLIPVVSWLMMRGKCRTCKKPIGYSEILAEVGLAAALVLSYIFWPTPLNGLLDWALFTVWIGLLLLLTIHIVYDAKWLLLLDKITIIIAILAVIFVVLRVISTGTNATSAISTMAASLVILPGLYAVLYFYSRGSWIGFGDVKLLLPLAAMLPSWQSAILMLFLANFIGFIVLIPGMLAGKITRSSRIPFGPFLILAWFITMVWGSAIVRLYLGASLVI